MTQLGRECYQRFDELKQRDYHRNCGSIIGEENKQLFEKLLRQRQPWFKEAL